MADPHSTRGTGRCRGLPAASTLLCKPSQSRYMAGDICIAPYELGLRHPRPLFLQCHTLAGVYAIVRYALVVRLCMCRFSAVRCHAWHACKRRNVHHMQSALTVYRKAMAAVWGRIGG